MNVIYIYIYLYISDSLIKFYFDNQKLENYSSHLPYKKNWYNIIEQVIYVWMVFPSARIAYEIWMLDFFRSLSYKKSN